MIFLKYKNIFIFCLLMVIGLTVYGNTFNNEFFWDDDDSIVNNNYIRSWENTDKFFSENLIAGAGQISNYYRPVLLISFAVDYHLWGLDVFGFHLTNTLLHIISAYLVYLILFRLICIYKEERYDIQDDVKYLILPFSVSLLFLIHPLQTEAVTYIAGRADSLSSVFSLMAIYFYIKFRYIVDRKDVLSLLVEKYNKLRFFYYFIILLFFILGLLTKEQVILLPALILLVELIFFFKNISRKNIFKSFKFLFPLFLISGIYFLIRIYLLNFNDLLGGTEYGASYDASILNRIFTFGWVIVLYFKILFIPTGLHMAREIANATFLQFAIFLVLLLFIIIVSVKTWREERLVTFGFLWFFIILLPRSNILPINRPMYEHWLYLPMVGFWLAVLSLLVLLFKKIKSKNNKYAIYFLYLIFFISFFTYFSTLTILRNNDWENPITFYEKNLEYTPNSFIQHNNLGMAYSDKSRHEDAIKEYKKAMSIADKYPQVHSNLANSLRDTGRIDEAILEYEIAIKMSPTFSIPYYALMNIYIDSNKKESLVRLLKSMEIIFREDLVFNYNSGLAYYSIEEYDLAIEHWKRILNKNPNNIKIRNLINEARIVNSNNK